MRNFDAAQSSLEQDTIRSGGPDGGFLKFMPRADSELDQLFVDIQHARSIPVAHTAARQVLNPLRPFRRSAVATGDGAGLVL
jgi:hypothetical protein